MTKRSEADQVRDALRGAAEHTALRPGAPLKSVVHLTELARLADDATLLKLRKLIR